MSIDAQGGGVMRGRVLRTARNLVLTITALMPGIAAPAAPANGYVNQRRHMVQEIADLARELGPETGRAQLGTRTLDAMRRVPRHRFTASGDERAAYHNRALPIGSGQTISQPYVVALMTDLLELAPGDRVLEIGTGSGYQAAVLAELVAQVYTVEIVEPLARAAAQRLAGLGYRNVMTRAGDGYEGWAQHAPYDAIVVTAAPPEVPAPLLAQLKPRGRMVIPLGARGGVQVLHLVRKLSDGTISRTAVLRVRFVPFTGEAAEHSRAR